MRQLVPVLVVALFVGCGGSEDDDQASSDAFVSEPILVTPQDRRDAYPAGEVSEREYLRGLNAVCTLAAIDAELGRREALEAVGGGAVSDREGREAGDVVRRLEIKLNRETARMRKLPLPPRSLAPRAEAFIDAYEDYADEIGFFSSDLRFGSYYARLTRPVRRVRQTAKALGLHCASGLRPGQ